VTFLFSLNKVSTFGLTRVS